MPPISMSSRAAFAALIIVSPSLALAKDAPSTVSLGIRQPLLVVTVDDDGEEEGSPGDHSIVYEPEVPTIGVLGASYKSVAASYSHNLNGESDDELDYTNYGLGLFYESFGLDLQYTEFEHFQVTQSSGFDDQPKLDDKRRLTMASRYTAANLYWFPLRFGYDLDAATDPAKVKSAGLGFGAIGSYTSSAVDTPDGMVPKAWQTAFGPDGRFEAGELSCLALQGAFGATIAIGPAYLTGLAAFGLGLQHFSYETDTETHDGKGIADKETFRVAAGYSAKRTFFSVSFAQESPRYVLKNMSLTAESSDLAAVFGVKF